jgi:hypothetical protein
MQPQTIKESTPETVEAIKAFRQQADDCYKSLTLLALPGNLAIWGALTEGVRLIEQARATDGDNSSDLDASLINVGRSGATPRMGASSIGSPLNSTRTCLKMKNRDTTRYPSGVRMVSLFTTLSARIWNLSSVSFM